MHLQEKNKKCNHRHNCDCNKKAQRFDEAYTSAPSTLEEHFENFTGAVGEVAEDFLGMNKKRSKKALNTALHVAVPITAVASLFRKKKRAAAPVTAAPSINENESEIPTRLTKISSGLANAIASSPNLKNQAENQALQVNQLASMVQPSSKAVTPSETATASGTEGGSEELYKTLPDSEEKAQEAPAASEQTAKGTEAVPVEEAAAAPAKSTKKTGLIVIAVVAVAVIAWLKFKKKI